MQKQCLFVCTTNSAVILSYTSNILERIEVIRPRSVIRIAPNGIKRPCSVCPNFYTLARGKRNSRAAVCARPATTLRAAARISFTKPNNYPSQETDSS